MFPQFPIMRLRRGTCGHVGIAPFQDLFDREIPDGAATTRNALRRRIPLEKSRKRILFAAEIPALINNYTGAPACCSTNPR